MNELDNLFRDLASTMLAVETGSCLCFFGAKVGPPVLFRARSRRHPSPCPPNPLTQIGTLTLYVPPPAPSLARQGLGYPSRRAQGLGLASRPDRQRKRG